tara:strand:+ start:1202 stop:1411 length:210 start_codon:yes stop_codon:yes gene_type:complete
MRFGKGGRMKKYKFAMMITEELVTEVEANSLEEAEEIAYDASLDLDGWEESGWLDRGEVVPIDLPEEDA